MSSREIAVAVATCGRPASLARCLEGLAAGEALPGEVLVIDQAPSDEARDLVERSGLDRIRYVEQGKHGLSASRNLALSLTSLPALAVTDDDCVPDPSWLLVLAAALEREPAPAAVTGAILALGEPAGDLYAVSLRDSSTPVDYAGRVLPWRVGSGANFVARCELLRRCAGWDERLGVGSPGQAAEDAELLYRLLRAGQVVRYEPGAVVRHELQTRDRRLATRWSYGYGVGAMCGVWARRGDAFAAAMLLGYARLHVRPLVSAVVRRDARRASEHFRALASLGPGFLRGLRSGRRIEERAAR